MMTCKMNVLQNCIMEDGNQLVKLQGEIKDLNLLKNKVFENNLVDIESRASYFLQGKDSLSINSTRHGGFGEFEATKIQPERPTGTQNDFLDSPSQIFNKIYPQVGIIADRNYTIDDPSQHRNAKRSSIAEQVVANRQLF